MVEFALVAPLMLLMVLGMIDLGRAFVFGVTVQEGARQAARLASTANYDSTVDDTAVLGRLISSADPALVNCTRATGSNPACSSGTWTFTIGLTSTSGATYSSIATARANNALAGATATITARGSVALVPGFRSELFGVAMPQITVQGQATMVVL
jgi:Flp pilus assembly protein TadG